LRKIEQEAFAAGPLVQGAQRCCDVFFESFEESIVLARLFVTLLYRSLPPEDQAFVQSLACRKSVEHLVTDTTPVLALLGSRGVNGSWGDRRLSQNYRGIPLVSVALVESMPMTAKLFRELAPDLGWLADRDRGLVRKAWGSGPAGLFFVKDAESSVDAQGRRVVVARDFVRQYGVKTVFGVGRCYGENTLLAMLLFVRETLTEAQALEFLPIASALRGVTLRAIGAQRVFSEDPSSIGS
jgi:hypothetical protein